MASITQRGSGDVSCTSATGNGAVMTTGTTAQHFIVIHRIRCH